MAKILAPNEQYSGVSASVIFVNGQGETDKLELIEWFEKHGYEVEAETIPDPPKTLEEMTVEELTAYANEKNIDIGKATTQSGILEKIKAIEAE